MGKKYHHLTWEDRLYLERLTRQKYPKKEIAKIMGCSLATVYNELKRGAYEHLKSDLTTEIRYSPQKSYITYKDGLKRKGRTPKLELDVELRNYIKYLMKEQDFSPEAVLFEIRENKLTFTEEVKSVQTIYTGIRKGIFDGVTMKDIPRHGKTKRKKKKVEKLPAYIREQKGKSIEERPEDIGGRESFGHWEMDCLVGKLTNRKTALVLTERKTRFEIVERLKTHTTSEVIKALNRLEKKMGSAFYQVFKTITVDNGSEFKDSMGMEKALRRKSNRTNIYYCHPRSPNERGSNENANILLRRCSGLEKGSNFDKTLTYRTCKDAQFWINTYPRGILNGKCSMELFNQELDLLDIKIDFEL